jgi:hypothetical protein
MHPRGGGQQWTINILHFCGSHQVRDDISTVSLYRLKLKIKYFYTTYCFMSTVINAAKSCRVVTLQCPDGLWGPHSLLSNWYQRLFSLRPGREADHSHLVPSSRMVVPTKLSAETTFTFSDSCALYCKVFIISVFYLTLLSLCQTV